MSVGAEVAINLTGSAWTDLSEVTTRAQFAYGRFGGLQPHRAGYCRVTLAAKEGATLPIPATALASPQTITGRRIRIRVTDPDGGSLPVLVWTGWLDEVSSVVRQGTHTVDLLSVDAIGWLAGRQVTLPDTTPAELTGARINRILTAAGWPSDQRAIDAGVTTCAALSAPLTGDALVLCAETADTDPGRLVSSSEPTEAITFLGSANTGTNHAIFNITDNPASDSSAHWAEWPQAVNDPELLITEIVYEASDGESRATRSPTAAAAYGVWTLWRRFHSTPAVAASVAGKLLAGLSVPRTTVRSARVALHTETTAAGIEAAARVIGDRVAAYLRKNNKPQTVVGMIDGIACDIAPLHPPSGTAQVMLEWDVFPLGIYAAGGFTFLPPDEVPDLPVNKAAVLLFAPATGGKAPITYAASALPTGLAWSSSDLAIQGTPTALGETDVTVTATDSTTPTALSAEVQLKLKVVSEIAFTFTVSQLLIVQGGTPGSWTFPAPTGGVTPRTWKLSDISNVKAAIVDGGGTTVRLTLTPPAKGTIPNTADSVLTATVSDTHSEVVATVPVRVRVPLTVAGGAALPQGHVARAYSALMPVSPTGGTGNYRYEVAISGSGATGLVATTTADSQGRLLLSGTPQRIGNVSIACTAIDQGDNNNRASTTFTLAIAATPTSGLVLPPTIELPEWTVGDAVDVTLPAATSTTNLSPISYSLTGLPGGLTFGGGNRKVTGTAPAEGTYRWTYRAVYAVQGVEVLSVLSTVIATVQAAGVPITPGTPTAVVVPISDDAVGAVPGPTVPAVRAPIGGKFSIPDDTVGMVGGTVIEHPAILIGDAGTFSVTDDTVGILDGEGAIPAPLTPIGGKFSLPDDIVGLVDAGVNIHTHINPIGGKFSVVDDTVGIMDADGIIPAPIPVAGGKFAVADDVVGITPDGD